MTKTYDFDGFDVSTIVVFLLYTTRRKMPTTLRYRRLEEQARTDAAAKPGAIIFNLQEGKQMVVTIDRSTKGGQRFGSMMDLTGNNIDWVNRIPNFSQWLNSQGAAQGGGELEIGSGRSVPGATFGPKQDGSFAINLKDSDVADAREVGASNIIDSDIDLSGLVVPDAVRPPSIFKPIAPGTQLAASPQTFAPRITTAPDGTTIVPSVPQSQALVPLPSQGHHLVTTNNERGLTATNNERALVDQNGSGTKPC